MPEYRNLNGDSGVVRYECGPDWIEIEFEKGAARIYRYTYMSASVVHVETMKRLAAAGEGLNAYVNRHVAKMYASKR